MSTSTCPECENECVGCGPLSTPVMPPASTALPCVPPPPCTTASYTDCVFERNTEDVLCGEDIVYSTGLNQAQINAAIITYFCGRLALISITYAQALVLMETAAVRPGDQYLISDRSIILEGVTTGSFSLRGKRFMPVVLPSKYTASGTHLGVWNPDIVSVSIGNTVVHGGRVWQSVNGTLGTVVDPTTLDPAAWTVIATTNISNYYIRPFEVIFDINNDWVVEQKDEAGNVFGISFEKAQDIGLTYNYCDISDWGNPTVHDNKVWGVFNNTPSVYSNANKGVISGNYSAAGIFGNTNEGDILDNRAEVHNNSNKGIIAYNTASTYKAILFNSNRGAIILNTNEGDIFNNTNNGSIQTLGATTTIVSYNINNGDIFTTVVGVITDPIVNK